MSIINDLKSDIESVKSRDPAARNVLEIITTYPGFHALFFYRITHRLWRWELKFLARWLSGFARWFTGIEIHPAAMIGERFFIDHGMGVVIGETTEIGDDCTLYQGVTLGGTSTEAGKRHPTLRDGVIVGAGAKILGPIELGDRVKVGSNAVVVNNVSAGLTVVGVPGKTVSAKQTILDKVEFDAYGISACASDPEAEAISAIVEHLKNLDEKLIKINQSLESVGAQPINLSDLPNSKDELEKKR